MHDLEQTAGASRNPAETVKGEVMATLSDLRRSHDIGGMELGGLVIAALMNHIETHDGLEVRTQLSSMLARNSAQTLDEIEAILAADKKQQNQLH